MGAVVGLFVWIGMTIAGIVMLLVGGIRYASEGDNENNTLLMALGGAFSSPAALGMLKSLSVFLLMRVYPGLVCWPIACLNEHRRNQAMARVAGQQV